MASRRETILILEDTFDRIQRFDRVLDSALPNVRAEILNTASEMLALIKDHLQDSFAVSLDHDLYVVGVDDPGDGLQVATKLSTITPCCPAIIHTSNSDRGRQMQGVLESRGWDVRLAGAIGSNWIESDWISEVSKAYLAVNP